jgi:hypothetical protein
MKNSMNGLDNTRKNVDLSIDIIYQCDIFTLDKLFRLKENIK